MTEPSDLEKQKLEELGFCFDEGGTHLARTMMLDDLSEVFSVCGELPNKDAVLQAVDEENCLGKPSAKARRLAARHLLKLYSFESKTLIFRALAYLWHRDEPGRPQIALLVAYARDLILRESAPFIFELKNGEPYVRDKLEEFMDALHPGRFSPAMLRSLAQNLAGTWTQSGHLIGRSKKNRHHSEPTPGAITMALLLSLITGSRGALTFESEYVKLLDCTAPTAIELAKSASQRGWLNIKQIGEVIEVSFPGMITAEELVIIRE